MAVKRMSAAEYVNTPKPRSKYGNKRTVVDGLTFDSKSEAVRWQELVLLQRARKIGDLQRQVRVALMAHGGDVIGHYLPEFVYHELDEHGRVVRKVTEDVKGGTATQTELFRWKARHFKAQFGYDITIIGGPRRSTRSKRK